MALLDLANFPVATGATTLAVAVGATIGAEGGATNELSSFNDLLQARTGGEVAGESPVFDLSLPWEMALPTDQGEAGESSEPLIETDDDDDSEVTTAEPLAEMPSFGLPLVMEARAALRNDGDSGIEPASSGVTAAADSVDSARLRLLLRATTTAGRLTESGCQLPLPVIDSPVGAASDDTVSLPLDGAAVSRLEASRAPVAKLADSQLQSGLAVTGVVASITVSVATAVGVEEVAAPTMTATNGDERIATDQTGIASDRPSAQPASGWPLQGYSRLAGILAQTGSTPAMGDWPVSNGEARPVAITVAGSNQPLPLASRDTSAFATVARNDPRLSDADVDPTTVATAATVARNDPRLSDADVGPTTVATAATVARSDPRLSDADVDPATWPSEEAVQEVVVARVGESTAPMSDGTLTQAGPSSAAPARPDTGTSSVLPSTAPEVLDLRQKNWEQVLGHQLNSMVNNGVQEAEIKVNPPDLGPLEVRVSLRHDQTSVTFFSHEAAVRDAIESALPRLREMLNDQGINLNQVQMSDQSLSRQQAGAGDQPANGQRNGRWPMSAPVSEPGVDAVESQPRPRSRWGRVDDYA